MNIGNLRCEYSRSPICVDVENPRLSWEWKTGERSCVQSAYQILVASNPELLSQDVGDVWDSGCVESDQCVKVQFKGERLSARKTYHWKVRAWNAEGRGTGWSDTACWTTGMLKEPWPGNYIGLSESAGDNEHPLLRKTFELQNPPLVGRAYVNALGYYELYCNGKKVDDHILMPAPAQYDKMSHYTVHDITRFLTAGINTIGFWLGRGWYRQGLPGVAHSGPVVRAFVEAGLAQDEVVRISTDETWVGRPSHYSRIGEWRHSDFGGEKVDGRARINGWSSPRFDASGWSKVICPTIPYHGVRAQYAEPNRAVRTFQPQNIKPLTNQSWLIDFGRNITGTFLMHFNSLKSGQKVCFEFADNKDDLDGKKKEQPHSVYIGRGETGEKFENKFNYHGFRYVIVNGLTEQPAFEDVEAKLVRTDYRRLSYFHCSNELLNDIHDMINYTFECLSLGGYMVDCPHIERLGYGGDGLASTPSALKMYGMGPLYTNWMALWRACQQPDGGLPHTAPNPWKAGGGPFWCAFAVGAPWYAYLHYADQIILKNNYPAMKHWLNDYVGKHLTDNGMLMGWPDEDYRHWYLGDWALPQRREKQFKKSVHLVNNCVIVQCYEWMRKIAAILECSEDETFYLTRATELRRQVHENFFDTDRCTYADDTQIDIAYPLLVDVPPKELRPRLVARLEKNIMEKNDGHLDVGLVGVSVLTQALMKLDRNDLVYSYINKRAFPGWGHMLDNGATTTWEHWDGQRSRIHNCYNGIGEWFYRAPGGIQIDDSFPGYRHFRLRPFWGGDLKQVTAHMESPFGTIRSEWEETSGFLFWNVTIPPNTIAEVFFPVNNIDSIKESGNPIGRIEGCKAKNKSAEEVMVELRGGSYRFEVNIR